jgi:hypothetical protein
LLGPVGATITAEAGNKVIEPPVAGKGEESDEEYDEEYDEDYDED